MNFNQEHYVNLRGEYVQERQIEVTNISIEPLYLCKMQSQSHLYLIISEHQSVYQSLLDKFNSGLFTLQWELRSYVNNRFTDKVKLIYYQNYFYLNAKKMTGLYCSHTYFYKLTPSNNTIRRAIKNLESFQTMNEQIRLYLTGNIDKFEKDDLAFDDSEFPNQLKLNESQKQAVRLSMKFPLTVVQGPPGTGKTVCIVALAMIFLKRGLKVMICGPSNQSILYIARLFLKHKFDPESTFILLSQIVSQNLDVSDLDHLNFYKRMAIIAKERLSHEDHKVFTEQLQQFVEGMTVQSNQFFCWLGQFQKQITRQAKVICSTVSCSGKYALSSFVPDLTIIDEAGQASEADTIIAMNKGSRVVLVGDQCQLLPVCTSQNPDLMKSMLAKVHFKSPELSSMLKIQYRMHPVLAEFTNKEFYNGQIQNETTAKSRSSNIILFDQSPMLIISHNSYESQYKTSYYSEHEVNLINEILNYFPTHELPNLGIITPFAPQLRLLESSLFHLIKKGLQVKVLDGYQGNEKDYIIISFVRSNYSKHVGYLSLTNRTNVALTRARKGMIIVGNLETLRSDLNNSPWKKLVQHYEKEVPHSILSEQQFRQKVKHSPEYQNGVIQPDFHFDLQKLIIEPELLDEEMTLEAETGEAQKVEEKFPELPKVQEQKVEVKKANYEPEALMTNNLNPETKQETEKSKQQAILQTRKSGKSKKFRNYEKVDISGNIKK